MHDACKKLSPLGKRVGIEPFDTWSNDPMNFLEFCSFSIPHFTFSKSTNEDDSLRSASKLRSTSYVWLPCGGQPMATINGVFEVGICAANVNQFLSVSFLYWENYGREL